MSFETANPFSEPSKKTRIDRENYSLRLLPGVKGDLPAGFIDQAYEFALKYGVKLKHVNKTDKGVEGVNEIVWKMTDEDGHSFVLKLVQSDKMSDPDHELHILERAQKAGLPAPKPFGMMHVGSAHFLIMEYVSGRSGQDIWDELTKQGWTMDEIEIAQVQAEDLIRQTAELYRQKLNIDKPWYIKDFLLNFDGHRLKSVFPLDFERSHTFDPQKPDKIRVILKMTKSVTRAA